MPTPLLILIAGPYRSGTGDDPERMAANLAHVDAVLRLPGASTGADQDVALARRRGIPVYHAVEEIPDRSAAGAR